MEKTYGRLGKLVIVEIQVSNSEVTEMPYGGSVIAPLGGYGGGGSTVCCMYFYPSMTSATLSKDIDC
jgi:hypothetical protein